jgi:hypothetical protein
MSSLLSSEAMQIQLCLLSNRISKQENNHQQNNQFLSNSANGYKPGQLISTKTSKAGTIIHLSTIYATVNGLQAVCSSGSRKQLTQNHT